MEHDPNTISFIQTHLDEVISRTERPQMI